MRYEIYVDSLIFINFTMNLYLLIWVNRSTFRTATSGRMILGAMVGAVGFLLTVSGVGPPGVRVVAGLVIGVVGMLVIPFSVSNLRMFVKLLAQLAVYSFMMGGALLFLLQILPGCRQYLVSCAGIAGMGGVFFLLFGRHQVQPERQGNLCRVTLMRKGKEMTVTALLDSGNSLVEPISGKPVCVVESSVQEQLWGSDTAGFRAIPYHSIGKQNGIMWGYPLETLTIHVDGMKLCLKEVYLAVSNETISERGSTGGAEIKMIINPELLKEGRGRRERQNVRRNDFESSNTGKNAI